MKINYYFVLVTLKSVSIFIIIIIINNILVLFDKLRADHDCVCVCVCGKSDRSHFAL